MNSIYRTAIEELVLHLDTMLVPHGEIETISKTGEGMLICQERLDMWEEIAPGIRRRKKGYIYEQ